MEEGRSRRIVKSTPELKAFSWPGAFLAKFKIGILPGSLMKGRRVVYGAFIKVLHFIKAACSQYRPKAFPTLTPIHRSSSFRHMDRMPHDLTRRK